MLVTDVRPLASRAARSGKASESLPSRTRGTQKDDTTVSSAGTEAFLARARESAVDDSGLDHSTLSAIKDRLRDV